jgi:pimeloyl-ACP methyl ester carboxylesterase
MVPSHFTTDDGFELCWYELAGGTGAPPIILQHGYGAQTISEWVDSGIAERLAALGRRVIALDAIGHGASAKPHDSRFYGEARMARDLSSLATHLEFASFDLVGYSMGAIVALLAAAADRRVRRLAIGGVGEAVVLLGGVDTRALDNRELAAAMRAADPGELPQFVRLFRENAVARGNDLLALAAQADVVHCTPVPLERIAAPVLVLAGTEDPLAVRPETLAAAIPDARLVRVPGDHGQARLEPTFMAALEEFLR